MLIVAVNGYLQVGDEYTEPCVRNLAENGRYLVVGFAAGDIPAVPANLVLMRCATDPCTPDAFASKVTVMNVAAETPRWSGRRGVTGR